VYHPLNKIICPPLNKLNELVQLTLEFSLTQTLVLAAEEIHLRFAQHFNVNGYPLAGDWLWGKTALVRPHVLALLPIPVPEKKPIFEAYVQNQDFKARFAVGSFVEIYIPPVSQAAYNSAAELAANFYTILCDGVPGEKINELEQLDRQTVLRAYLDAQRSNRLQVCPGCDGEPPSVSGGIIHEDIDHFFPKSKYPFLAIHPLNLTPFCKDCNQTYKSDKDAILDKDPRVVDVHALCDIYHPYQCPAKEDLLLQINVDGNDNHPVFRFSQVDINHPARLHSFIYLLDIESRWTGNLYEERIQQRIELDLLYASEEDRKQENFRVEENWFTVHINNCISSYKRGIGHLPDRVSAYAYAQWIQSTPEESKKWLERAQEALKNYA
jgi:hypothetical protein